MDLRKSSISSALCENRFHPVRICNPLLAGRRELPLLRSAYLNPLNSPRTHAFIPNFTPAHAAFPQFSPVQPSKKHSADVHCSETRRPTLFIPYKISFNFACGTHRISKHPIPNSEKQRLTPVNACRKGQRRLHGQRPSRRTVRVPYTAFHGSYQIMNCANGLYSSFTPHFLCSALLSPPSAAYGLRIFRLSQYPSC